MQPRGGTETGPNFLNYYVPSVLGFKYRRALNFFLDEEYNKAGKGRIWATFVIVGELIMKAINLLIELILI